MQVVACQLDIAWEDKLATHERVKLLLATTAVPAGSLIVLPEMFATGFSMHVAAIAEDRDGPTHKFLASLATAYRSYVLAGLVTAATDGRGFNEAVLFDPAGREVGRYAKLHPFSYGGETAHYQPGDDVQVWAIGEWRVAPLVCYDLRFPEAFRRATRRGAQLFAVIANWPQARDAHWQALLKARAIENQAYVVGLNRVGSDPKLQYVGHSQVIDPRGELLAAGGESEQLLTAAIELPPLEEYRRQFPALADMRGDLNA